LIEKFFVQSGSGAIQYAMLVKTSHQIGSIGIDRNRPKMPDRKGVELRAHPRMVLRENEGYVVPFF
jgi:hypothetical protein